MPKKAFYISSIKLSNSLDSQLIISAKPNHSSGLDFLLLTSSLSKDNKYDFEFLNTFVIAKASKSACFQRSLKLVLALNTIGNPLFVYSKISYFTPGINEISVSLYSGN